MSHHLQGPPVPDEVGLQTQQELPHGEWNVNPDPHHHGVLAAHVLHDQDEADHEAGDSSHSCQEPQDGEDVDSIGSSAPGSGEPCH